MPHALLLSPDDQAVSAITGVLQEMGVSCERPLDGVSAAQKLNSQSFDLVLVDCENLPAAKLIFDVCRRGKSGNQPVPIAIVDGRAGLPTAFRLGAELILTKPVAKDQARSTIRSAVGRVRRDVEVDREARPKMDADDDSESERASLSGAAVAPALSVDAAADEVEMSAADTSKSQAASFNSLTSAMPADSVNARIARMVKASEEAVGGEFDDAAPQDTGLDGTVATPLEKSVATPVETPLATTPETRKDMNKDKSVAAAAPSGAGFELDSAAVKPKARTAESRARDVESGTASAAKFAGLLPRGSSGQKTPAPVIALLMLVLAAGGFYAAWTYQTGFRDIIKPQIERWLARGERLVPASAPRVPKPSAVVTAPRVLPRAPSSTMNSKFGSPNSLESAATSGKAAGTSAIAETGKTATVSQPAVNAPATVLKATREALAGPVNPVQANPPVVSSVVRPVVSPVSEIKVSGLKVNNGRNYLVAGPSAAAPTAAVPAVAAASANGMPLNAPATFDNTTIILSSKGAANRLAYSVAPNYPAMTPATHATSAGAQAGQVRIVLKAVIDASGKVAGVQAVEGDTGLTAAAVAAVKQWRYRPYVRDGKAQPFQTIVMIDVPRP